MPNLPVGLILSHYDAVIFHLRRTNAVCRLYVPDMQREH